MTVVYLLAAYAGGVLTKPGYEWAKARALAWLAKRVK